MSNAIPLETRTLQANIERRDLDPALERVLKRVRLRAQRRTAWLRKLWSEEEPPGGTFAVTHGEVDTHLLDKDSPASEGAWFATDPLAIRLTREIEALEAQMAIDEDSRLARLRRSFDLDPEDTDILQGCLANVLDPSLTRVYAYLQDRAGRGYATEELIGRVFEHGRRSALRPDSPLRLWQLIAEREPPPGEPLILECDPTIRNWLYGRDHLDDRLIGVAHWQPPMPPLENWPIAETVSFLNELIRAGTTVRVQITGPMGSGRRTLAAEISRQTGRNLLALDADRISDSEWRDTFLRAQRYAHLLGCALAWFGETASERTWPDHIAWSPLQFVVCESRQGPAFVRCAVERRIDMPEPSIDEKRHLWHLYVPASRTWDDENVNQLFERGRVTVGSIAEFAQTGVQTAEEATVFIRDAARRRLGELVRVLDCPFDWDDLVVSDYLRRILEDLVFEAGHRAAFWEQASARRLFPQGRGLFALFCGPSGTGKTMAAQVIARSLDRDLYHVDLSTIVSKYVGDTAKNLRRILSSVPDDEVLLFDEADTLFGKRTEVRDAHDRFANTDTNYLLQAVEAYRGIVVLATNRKSDIDPAFTRRLRYIADFAKPDAALRLQIWRRLLGELGGPSTLENFSSGLEVLSREVEATGGQIKYAVLSALFAARRDAEPLDIKHLLHGLERELRKEGRGWSARERERLMRHGG